MGWEEHSDESLISYAENHLQHQGPAAMEMQRRLLLAIRAFNESSGKQSRVMIRLTWAIAALTVVLAIIAVSQLWVMRRPLVAPTLSGSAHNGVDSSAAGASRQSGLFVEVPGRTINLPEVDWKPMDNPETYATNFEARKLGVGEAFPQVVTVFKVAMSDRDRIGLKVTDKEYAEFFTVHPGLVTLQLRVDRGSYWLLSRQTFKPPTTVKSPMPGYQPVLPEAEQRVLLEVLDSAIKKTRFQLQQLF